MPDQTGQPRNEDEHNSANRRYADKFSNRIRDSKAAPRLPGPGNHVQGSSATARKPRIELSLTQILGSTGAAVTAAFLGSRLGVAGTLIGAALASVISVVGGAIYTSSIKATRRRVSEVIVAVRSQDDDIHGENQGAKHDSGGQPELMAALRLLPVGPGVADAVSAATSAAAAPGRPARLMWPRHLTWRSGPTRVKRLTLGTALIGGLLTATVFAGALVIVTGYETVSGTAISGGQSGGLTILGGGRASPGTPTKIPTTTATTTPTSRSTTTGTAATGTTTSATTSTATTSSTVTTTATTTGTPTTSSTTGTTAPVGPPTTATSSGTGTPTAASTTATSGSAAGAAQPNVQTSRTP